MKEEGTQKIGSVQWHSMDPGKERQESMQSMGQKWCNFAKLMKENQRTGNTALYQQCGNVRKSSKGGKSSR